MDGKEPTLYSVEIASTITERFGVVAESKEEAKEKALNTARANDFGGVPESMIQRSVVWCQKQS